MPDLPPPSLPPDTVRFSEPPDSERAPDTVRMSSPPSSRRPSLLPPPSRGSGPPSSRRSVPPPAAIAIAAATLMPACAVQTRSEIPPPHDGQAVTLAQLDVTSGVVEEKAKAYLTTSSGAMRAVAPHTVGDAAELRFTYMGRARETTRLANGEVRSQVGLKLRAEDSCNLLYVMWRFDGEQRLAVSVKRNPGRRTHEECGAAGYVNIAPSFTAPMPTLAIGERHVLRASVAEGRLLVMMDELTIWEGELPPAALSLDGPIGLRADNAELDMELVPIRTLAPARDPPPTLPVAPFSTGIPPPRR